MVDTLRDVCIEDWDICQRIARSHGRSFFLASRMLGAERRQSILAAYAYCRLADDIVDRADGDGVLTAERLAAWENELDRPMHPVSVAFAHARHRYGIPDQPIRELFDGMRADLFVNRYQNWPELRGYCHQVAGTVGLIVAPILGCSDKSALPYAADLGIAMQLTNILRDVGEDAAMNRIYLPLDELDRFGLDPEHLLAGELGTGFSDLMRFQIARARDFYESALLGVSALSPSGQLTTLAAAHLYAGILDQIEANHYQVFSIRAVVPRRQKARSTAGAAMRFMQLTTVSAWTARRHDSSPSCPAHRTERDIEGWIP